MSFLKLLRSIPKDGEISPELDHKLKSAANMFLAGRDSGDVDMDPGSDNDAIEYENRLGLEELSETEIIERENAEPTTKEVALERNFDEPQFTLSIINDDGREVPIAVGPRREIEQLKASLCMIRLKKGRKAYTRKIKKLREDYLSKNIGDFYEKGDY